MINYVIVREMYNDWLGRLTQCVNCHNHLNWHKLNKFHSTSSTAEDSSSFNYCSERCVEEYGVIYG